MSGYRCDAPALRPVRAEPGGRDIADIPVGLALSPGETVRAGLVDREPLARQQLRRKLRAWLRRRRQVEQGRGDPARLASDEMLRLDPSPQPVCGEIRPRGRQPVSEGAQVVEQNWSSRTRRIARAAWNAPPFGRAGFATGVQP